MLKFFFMMRHQGILISTMTASVLFGISCSTVAGVGNQKGSLPEGSSQLSSIQSSSKPSVSTVYIVRHGEKEIPEIGPDLNDQGRLRASRIPSWFTSHPESVTHGMPVAVIAAAPLSPGGSLRSIQTCNPFAVQHQIVLDSQFSKDQYDDAARLIRTIFAGNNKSVLVCWEHKMIPYLAHALGASDAPDSWPSETYDRVWMLTFKDGAFESFENLPQQLLPGDSSN